MIRKLVKNRRFNVIFADDGSGKGAALAAAVASCSTLQPPQDRPIIY